MEIAKMFKSVKIAKYRFLSLALSHPLILQHIVPGHFGTILTVFKSLMKLLLSLASYLRGHGGTHLRPCDRQNHPKLPKLPKAAKPAKFANISFRV